MEQNTIEEELLIYEEPWGLRLVLGEGAAVNNLNILPRIESILKIAKENQKSRILIEASAARRDLSILKLYQAGELLCKHRMVGIKIALVAPQYVNTDESLFMENVGSNRGCHIRFFSDSGEALSWIKS